MISKCLKRLRRAFMEAQEFTQASGSWSHLPKVTQLKFTVFNSSEGPQGTAVREPVVQ